jgi:hypothetical protein
MIFLAFWWQDMNIISDMGAGRGGKQCICPTPDLEKLKKRRKYTKY